MECTVDRLAGGVVILSIAGDVDRNTSPEVRTTLLPLFAEDSKAVVVDLSGVTYIDSSGIATLTEGLQVAQRSAIPFRLVGITPAVKNVFEMARLESLFAMYESRRAALEDLA
ncbi:MAG: STAS domain-containing protein [Candidatus Tectimicrobiota bacterium]